MFCVVLLCSYGVVALLSDGQSIWFKLFSTWAMHMVKAVEHMVKVAEHMVKAG